MRELLIVGIDPGTTLGYAVLDLKGNVIKTRSSKQLELNSLLEEIVRLGSVLAIGTDKMKCPGLVEKAAAKTGAKVILPDEDLAVAEKNELTKGRNTTNEHEKDALAAALYAYKELQPLLKRIWKALEQEGKQEIFREVTETVVMTGTNIRDAIREIEERMTRQLQERQEEQPIENQEKETAAENFLNLRLKRLEKENNILRNYNSKLLERIKHFSKGLRKTATKGVNGRRLDELDKNHSRLVAKMQDIINEKERQASRLREEQELLGRIMETGETIVKKIRTLGADDLPMIKENETVLVENPEIFSERALEHLRQRNATILLRRKITPAVARVFQDAGLTAIPVEGAIMLESQEFAAVNKARLAELRKRQANIFEVVEKYKEERRMHAQ